MNQNVVHSGKEVRTKRRSSQVCKSVKCETTLPLESEEADCMGACSASRRRVQSILFSLWRSCSTQVCQKFMSQSALSNDRFRRRKENTSEG